MADSLLLLVHSLQFDFAKHADFEVFGLTVTVTATAMVMITER